MKENNKVMVEVRILKDIRDLTVEELLDGCEEAQEDVMFSPGEGLAAMNAQIRMNKFKTEIRRRKLSKKQIAEWKRNKYGN